MIVSPIRTSVFSKNEPLAPFVFRHVRSVKEQSVIVVVSKIVALSQGRTAPLSQKMTQIEQESEVALKTPWCHLTLKDGHWCPNAGIDESNGNGELILWPQDPMRLAHDLWKSARKHYGVKKLGVLITDSRVFPLRAGVTGVALGYAGFKGLRDYRGKKDLFDRPLAMTQTNIADCLASAAVLAMGEGAERTPLGVIGNAPIVFTNKTDAASLRIDPAVDLFKPLYAGRVSSSRAPRGSSQSGE